MIRYPRANRAAQLWGAWVRDGRPKMTMRISGTLGKTGVRGDGEYFTAYGIKDTAYATGQLVDSVVFGGHGRSGVSDSLLMVAVPYYVRFHGREPLLRLPPEKKEEDGEPALSVTEIAIALGVTRATVYNRLNKVLALIEEAQAQLDDPPPKLELAI